MAIVETSVSVIRLTNRLQINSARGANACSVRTAMSEIILFGFMQIQTLASHTTAPKINEKKIKPDTRAFALVEGATERVD